MKRNQFNFEISPDLRNRLDRYSEKSGVPKAEIVRRAVAIYLARHDGKVVNEAGR